MTKSLNRRIDATWKLKFNAEAPNLDIDKMQKEGNKLCGKYLNVVYLVLRQKETNLRSFTASLQCAYMNKKFFKVHLQEKTY